jgi:hypothetical protein
MQVPLVDVIVGLLAPREKRAVVVSRGTRANAGAGNDRRTRAVAIDGRTSGEWWMDGVGNGWRQPRRRPAVWCAGVAFVHMHVATERGRTHGCAYVRDTDGASATA